MSTKDRIKEFLYKYKYVEKYLTDDIFQTQTMLLASLAMNIAAATFKFVMGVWFGSKWLVTVSIYFLTFPRCVCFFLTESEKVRS